MVTYVALLMFLQLGEASARATFYSALLFVPWILKAFARRWVGRMRCSKLAIHTLEVLLVAGLIFVAFSFYRGSEMVFLALFLVSLLSACHQLAVSAFFERSLSPSELRQLAAPRLVSSQVATILTYGGLIFLVGTFEVYLRQVLSSWAFGSYVAAGIFMLFALFHLFSLKKSCEAEAGQVFAANACGAAELPMTERLRRNPNWWKSAFMLFLLLFPQGLMFYARVLYLYGASIDGGLQCTMQEIGFAQGTIGVIAFCTGIVLGRRLVSRRALSRLFSPMALCIVLSPFVYLCMTIWPPTTLWSLCFCTLLAQFLFGFGLNVCRLPIVQISGERYRHAVNLLQVPVVLAVMFLPMAVSGWLVECLGFQAFFCLNVLSAPMSLLGIYLLRRREIPPVD